MEDVRTSTSSQRLASTFTTLIESPEDDITAINFVITESLLMGNSRDIPVSVQELVYGGKAARVGTSPKSLDRCHELIFSRPEEEVIPRKGQQPSGSTQASTSKNTPQQVQKKGKKTPKSNQKGKQKAKAKAKPKWNKHYPQNYRIPKKEKTAMDNLFNMARTLMEFKNKEEEKLNQSFPQK
ncbi:hypothetical protein O181_105814 [Austropuccinia psidii MF-1]|uniref:Uncharacterized protein n=1 Tax=Austropuccinia psidii MF-1 TaxID=1389203 RepID=A0A9Q3JQ47_9BASI|nr:hypothetical protein [Austropuccinia psidii MF-1]